jgi:hypothetical protein
MDSDETPFRAWWKRQAWIRFLILLIAAWFLLMFILLPLTRIMSTGIVKCPQRLPELEGTIGKEQDTWERTFSLLGIVVAFGAAVFYRQFMPTVNVRLAPEWKDPANGILSLSLEVENNSRIGIRRDKSSVCVQVLEHDARSFAKVKFKDAEWVSFEEPQFQKHEKEWDRSAQWSEPQNVLQTPGIYEPDQVSHVEVLRKCSPEKWLHCAIRYKNRLNPIARWIRWQTQDRFTTTAWVAPAVLAVPVTGSGSRGTEDFKNPA